MLRMGVSVGCGNRSDAGILSWSKPHENCRRKATIDTRERTVHRAPCPKR
jgi:hypothetical protein